MIIATHSREKHANIPFSKSSSNFCLIVSDHANLNHVISFTPVIDRLGKQNYFDSKMMQKGKLTLLQCFPKNSIAADVVRNKCLHMTSSNAPFCMHYVDNVNYYSLIRVTFPLGSMGKHECHFRIYSMYADSKSPSQTVQMGRLPGPSQ